MSNLNPLSHSLSSVFSGQRGVQWRSINGRFASLSSHHQSIAERHFAKLLSTFHVKLYKVARKEKGKVTRAKYVSLACAKVDFNYWLVFGIDYFCLANRRHQLRSLIIQQLQSRNTMRQGFESRWHPGAFSAGCAPHTRILTNALRKPKSLYSVSTQKIFLVL